MTVIPLTLLRGRPDDGAAPPPSGCASSSSCGSPAETTGAPAPDPLPKSIAERIAEHPCYSQEAHRSFARMHIPVAPGCNIQCNYCNRKFDCSNESRPGVTTGLLTPERAVEKIAHVRAEVPQLRVIGVAGPGEPLANARRTLGALELVARNFPDLTLCVSTNGLTLLDHVDRIVELGIDHVTVTINMIDPEVGERIHPWITFGGRRWTGRDAARVLSERQLAGVEALTSRGVLCKINSVLIPGVNDEHLVDVSRAVRGLGAFLHNVMPLVSAPEHGTHFGLTGQRGPTPAELAAVQNGCEALAADGAGGGMSMGMMRHCRECRADAVGLLDEDRSQEFTGTGFTGTEVTGTEVTGTGLTGTVLASNGDDTEGSTAAGGELPARPQPLTGPRPAVTVRVAVATTSGTLVDQHFGHAEEFRVYEAGVGYARLVETRTVARYCHGPAACPPGTPTGAGHNLPAATELLSDCAAVLCSRVGAGPRRELATHGIEAVELYDVIEHAVTQVGGRLAGDPATGGAEASAS